MFYDKLGLAKPIGGRLGDITKPLFDLLMVLNPKLEPVFLRTLDLIKQKREVDRLDTLECTVFKGLLRCELSIRHNIVSVKEITKEINCDVLIPKPK